jgi:hypothetical protein
MTDKKRCPAPECEKTFSAPNHISSYERADWMADRLQRHVHNQHGGTLRITVTFEKEVSVHPEQDRRELVDGEFDKAVDAMPGYELAYVGGEYTEEPDDWEDKQE